MAEPEPQARQQYGITRTSPLLAVDRKTSTEESNQNLSYPSRGQEDTYGRTEPECYEPIGTHTKMLTIGAVGHR